ncbi:MAG: PDZ domain-containing protein [Terriglobales bacterium]|jgi:membrane-associated protease RseP (regulator of RpoE activity)
MIHRFLLCLFVLALVASMASSAHSEQLNYDRNGESWDWSFGGEEGGSSYLGVDIADVSAERLGELKLKEEHGAEVTMVDQDAPAGKAGLREHDVIVSLNGTAVESAAQLRRMIKETPPGRVVNLGISRDGQPVTIKVQLADRHKSMSWDPKVTVDLPKIELPNLPDFDIPISVVVVHQSARSGLMVENITKQLGDFFGVKDGNGVLVRSVEKGSRSEKSGFRAGDVIVKVNSQPVSDTSDFTHALRSSSGGTAAVTVIREKREQTLTLTLPAKKDSGSMLEDSLDIPDFTVETEQAINRAGEEIARLGPAISEKIQQLGSCRRDMEKKLLDSQRKLQDEQRKMQERQQKMRHELSGEWAEI